MKTTEFIEQVLIKEVGQLIANSNYFLAFKTMCDGIRFASDKMYDCSDVRKFMDDVMPNSASYLNADIVPLISKMSNYFKPSEKVRLTSTEENLKNIQHLSLLKDKYLYVVEEMYTHYKEAMEGAIYFITETKRNEEFLTINKDEDEQN